MAERAHGLVGMRERTGRARTGRVGVGKGRRRARGEAEGGRGRSLSVAWRRAGAASLLAGASFLTSALLAPPAVASPGLAPYIVSVPAAADGSAAANAVGAAGGVVDQHLDAAKGVLAHLNDSEVADLATQPGVVVTPDVTVGFEDVASTTAPSRPPADVFAQQTGANQLWTQGDTGSGVNVAVLDTGIDPLPDFAGRLVGGVDLSGNGNPFDDQYGHGTFVAGLIAGDGASSGGQYTGEAPGAGLVSIKVAGASGSTDLATVIEGVDWAIANRQALHIGVLNLSLGYLPISSTVDDPLDMAVENAWKSGIVVVASAGNYGPFNGTITAPGDDPLVITAGALDDQGQLNPALDAMTTFSSVGPTDPDGWFKPDLVASGRSVVSLAAPGSTVYQQNPSALVGTANFVGSGTSFSAAITSGAAALVLQAVPGARPSDVKARLLDTTLPGPVGNPFVDGHGDLNALGAVTSFVGDSVHLNQSTPTVPTAWGSTVSLASTWAVSSWNSANWDGAAWNGAAWNGASWNGAAWNGAAWNGAAWNGAAWNGAAWNGASWNGASWNGAAWNGAAWNGAAWNGAAWNGASWNGASWNGASWNGASWNGAAWNGASWNVDSWNGASWNGVSWNGASWN